MMTRPAGFGDTEGFGEDRRVVRVRDVGSLCDDDHVEGVGIERKHRGWRIHELDERACGRRGLLSDLLLDRTAADDDGSPVESGHGSACGGQARMGGADHEQRVAGAGSTIATPVSRAGAAVRNQPNIRRMI
jgi:hypothetical protein